MRHQIDVLSISARPVCDTELFVPCKRLGPLTRGDSLTLRSSPYGYQICPGQSISLAHVKGSAATAAAAAGAAAAGAAASHAAAAAAGAAAAAHVTAGAVGSILG